MLSSVQGGPQLRLQVSAGSPLATGSSPLFSDVVPLVLALMQAEISGAWKQYYRDLNRWNEEEDPEGRKATKLAKRHTELLPAFAGNDPEVEAGLAALYQDRRNWPNEKTE